MEFKEVILHIKVRAEDEALGELSRLRSLMLRQCEPNTSCDVFTDHFSNIFVKSRVNAALYKFTESLEGLVFNKAVSESKFFEDLSRSFMQMGVQGTDGHPENYGPGKFSWVDEDKK